MTDEHLLYQCIFDKVYCNKIELEIVLSKIKDKKLINGFLSDLYCNHDKYEIDKSVVLEMFAIFIADDIKMTDISSDELMEDYKYFKELMNKINSTNMSFNQIQIDLLAILIQNDLTKFNDELSKIDKINLKKFKEILLEHELYEYVKYVDKFI